MADELSTLPRLSGLVSLLTQFHLFPEAWIYGQLFVLNNLQREAYLLGAYSDHGFWLYFPVAFAVKTPLPTLILFLVTLILWGTKKLDRAKVNFPLVALASLFFVSGLVPFEYRCAAYFANLSISLRPGRRNGRRNSGGPEQP